MAAAGKIRRGDVFHQIRRLQIRLFQQRNRGLGHFAQIVRRNFGGHAHRNARRAVEQHHRQPRRQGNRLFKSAVVIGHEIHRALIEFGQQQFGNRCEPRFGVAHRRRAVAVARAEVADAVDQRIAQGKVLRHAHHRFIGRTVAVRMVFAENLADHARRLHRLGIGRQAHLFHRKQNPPLHRLLAVAHIGQRPPLDHAHRVFEIGALGILGENQAVAFLRRQRDGVGHGGYPWQNCKGGILTYRRRQPETAAEPFSGCLRHKTVKSSLKTRCCFQAAF